MRIKGRAASVPSALAALALANRALSVSSLSLRGDFNPRCYTTVTTCLRLVVKISQPYVRRTTRCLQNVNVNILVGLNQDPSGTRSHQSSEIVNGSLYHTAPVYPTRNVPIPRHLSKTQFPTPQPTRQPYPCPYPHTYSSRQPSSPSASTPTTTYRPASPPYIPMDAQTQSPLPWD